MIGNQVYAEYDGVQSEENFRTPSQTRAQSAQSDFSNPNFPCATLLPSDDYKATLSAGTATYNEPLVITSDTVKIPGFEKTGVKDSYGFLMHSMSQKTRTLDKAYSWGCLIFSDDDFASFRSTLDDSIGFANGESVDLTIQ